MRLKEIIKIFKTIFEDKIELADKNEWQASIFGEYNDCINSNKNPQLFKDKYN